jgi:hypothetical protein
VEMPLQEALFAVSREPNPHYKLGKSKVIVALKMEEIYSS